MEFFRIRKDIPFMKYALIFNVISILTFVLAVFFLVTRGLHLSGEFTGGTVMEVSYTQAADLPKVRETVGSLGYRDVVVQNFGTARDVMIRLPVQKGVTSAQQSEQVLTALRAQDAGVELRRTEFVGPQVGEELMTNGLLALGVVMLGIIIYLAFRFEWKFGVSAAFANFHDVVIILGFFAFFQWEFSLSVLAAVLAVLGYSVNESVVVFDRPRHHFHHEPHHHHPRLDRGGGAGHALLRWPQPALLCAGADDWHRVWHLLVHLCRLGPGHVAGCQARGFGQNQERKPRSQRPQRRGRGLTTRQERLVPSKTPAL